MTMVGIISLAGIVVNNAIVLVDFIELSRKRKRAELGIDKLPFSDIIDAIATAGAIRLRPVLLTAITTILGLIPLAVGLNIDFTKLFSYILKETDNVLWLTFESLAQLRILCSDTNWTCIEVTNTHHYTTGSN